jgi:hypothetical protein
MDEPIVTLSFALPASKAKLLLERLEGIELSAPGEKSGETQVVVPRLRPEDVGILMKGETAELVVKTFVEHGGQLFNKDLATALKMEARPQLTFKPLATLTLRLRKLGYGKNNWYTRERIDGKTFLRLKPEIASLFEHAMQLSETSRKKEE